MESDFPEVSDKRKSESTDWLDKLNQEEASGLIDAGANMNYELPKDELRPKGDPHIPKQPPMDKWADRPSIDWFEGVGEVLRKAIGFVFLLLLAYAAIKIIGFLF